MILFYSCKFNRSDHTNFGLYLNRRGKVKFCNALVETIKENIRLRNETPITGTIYSK